MSCAAIPFPPSSPAPFDLSAHLRTLQQDLALLQIHFPCSPSPASASPKPVQFTTLTFSNLVKRSPTSFSRFRPEPQNASKEEENIQDGSQPTNRPSRVPMPAGSLERRRPARLAIPDSARLASLTKVNQFAITGQETGIQSTETSLHGVSYKTGRKNSMEDTHTALTYFQGDSKQAFVGVFDGHGGKHAADFVAENLGRHVSMVIENDHDCKASLEDAMRNAYMATDAELFDKHVSGGACSVSAFMKNGRMAVANAGDCKAVLCRGGKSECLSTLHRASNEEERGRVEDLGGLVDCFNGTWRVQGTLAVTRAFGDINLKQWVSVEPAVKILDITKDCEFLILASDGLWDQMGDQEAVDCVRKILLDSKVLSMEDPVPDHTHQNDSSSLLKHDSSSLLKLDLHAKTVACNELILKACDRGNRDDITVMIVLLEAFCVL